MTLGSNRITFYCSRRLGPQAIPGSDGQYVAPSLSLAHTQMHKKDKGPEH